MRMITGVILALLLSGNALAQGVKRPFWNEHARQFMFAPSFDFTPAGKAELYRFTIKGAGGRTVSFQATEPTAPLTPVWADVPVGGTTVTVEALDAAGGKAIGVVG